MKGVTFASLANSSLRRSSSMPPGTFWPMPVAKLASTWASRCGAECQVMETRTAR